MIHQLKCEKKYFADCVSGEKTFAVIKNDMDFKVGDFIALNEFNDIPLDDESSETEVCALFEITYILDNSKYCKEGYVILGIAPCRITKTDTRFTAPVYSRKNG